MSDERTACRETKEVICMRRKVGMLLCRPCMSYHLHCVLPDECMSVRV